MSFSNFKETAIEYVKKAVAEDTEENYEAAYKLYVTALEYFKTVRRGFLRCPTVAQSEARF